MTSQSAPNPQPVGGNGRTIELTYGTFGKVYALVEGGITLDTYCPWNGDPRPRWMDEVAVQSGRQISGSFGPETRLEDGAAKHQSGRSQEVSDA